jgi:hypothetical protein
MRNFNPQQQAQNHMKRIIILSLALASSALAGGSARWNKYSNSWDFTNQYGQTTGGQRWNQYSNSFDFTNQYGQRTGSARWNQYSNSWDFTNQYGQ